MISKIGLAICIWILAAAVAIWLVGTGIVFIGTGRARMARWRRRGDSSRPREANPPPRLTNDARLNDSVWELYSPPQGKIPEMEIIFFHGLQVDDFEDAFWKTWVAKDDEHVVWPKDWLSKHLPEARILSVSYNSSATKIAGQRDMYLLGESLVQDIIHSDSNIGQTCPVFLVGHCLGGIVIKEFIISAIKRTTMVKPEKKEFGMLQTFLDNFRGAFFYATPHGGSKEITRFANRLKHPSQILHLLKTLDTDTARINNDFRQQRNMWNARTYALTESLPTSSLGFHGQVVEEASARNDVDGHYTHPQADHFTICQARDVEDFIVIRKLTQFITDTLRDRTKTHDKKADLALIL